MIDLELKYAIGIDIGGTYIKSGLVASSGRVLAEKKLPTLPAEGKDRIIADILELVALHKQTAEKPGLSLSGIGIGTAGYVDGNGTVADATDNIPGWAGTQLGRLIRENTGLPVAVDNDIYMLARGEWWAGAAQSLHSFLCISLGTGVGGCMMTEGHPYRGRNGYAVGYGHHTIIVDGASCTCGKRGCWEQYASVTALMRLAREEYDGSRCPASAFSLFKAAREGDEKALCLVERYARYVAVGLGNLIHLFNPEAIVVGGAVTKQGDFLFDKIRKYIAREVPDIYMTPPVSIVPAKSGTMSGVLGAAKSIFDGAE